MQERDVTLIMLKCIKRWAEDARSVPIGEVHEHSGNEMQTANCARAQAFVGTRRASLGMHVYAHFVFADAMRKDYVSVASLTEKHRGISPSDWRHTQH